ncbi:hypothetical protein [Lactococcus lactis]|uniref:hypothetical protein n=1 Tax=Lactococcus lactis TaxID=1358 RepID=UPI00345D29F4
MQSFEAKKVIEQKKKQLWLIKRFYRPIYGILSFSLLVTLFIFVGLFLRNIQNIKVKAINWFVVFFGVAGSSIILCIAVAPIFYWDKKVIILENEIRDISFWLR